MLNKLDPIYKEIAETLGYKEFIVRGVVESYFKAVRKLLSKVNYYRLKSFEGIKTNILIPGFGKFIVKNKYIHTNDEGKSKRRIKWKKYHVNKKSSI